MNYDIRRHGDYLGTVSPRDSSMSKQDIMKLLADEATEYFAETNPRTWSFLRTVLTKHRDVLKLGSPNVEIQV